MDIADPEYKRKVYDKILWAHYQRIRDSGNTKEYIKGSVPEKDIADLRRWAKLESYDMFGLRMKFIPYVIKYRVTESSLWQRVQGWSKYK